MSSKMVWSDFDEPFRPTPSQRRSTTERMRAKAGIAPEGGDPAPAPDDAASVAAAARHAAWLAEHDGFITPPGSFTISPVLAKQLGYREAKPPPAEPATDTDAELESLEEMRRD